jgi:hypothetical protein
MNDCPYGIKNEKDIQYMGERFNMMIEHLGEGMDSLNKKMDNMAQQLDSLQKNLPSQIDKAVEEKLRANVYSIIKWLIVTATAAAIVIYVARVINS